MKINPSWLILSAALLIGAFLIGLAAFVAGGAGAWWALDRLAAAPPTAGVTPLEATPVRPLPATQGIPRSQQTRLATAATRPPGATPSAPDGQNPTQIQTTVTPGETPGLPEIPQPADASCIPLNRPATAAQVQRVIDAVTIDVLENGVIYSVGYLGAALPDASQNADPGFLRRARQVNEDLVAGKTVLLVQDTAAPDAATPNAGGARLRYVLAGGVFVNYEMIARGYAIAAENPPNHRCKAFLLEAEQRASDAALGAWAAAPTATRDLIPSPTATVAVSGPLLITGLSERGTIWEEPEEFVEFRNDSREAIQLEGWTLQDDERHIFTFPAFVLGPGEYCRVYTNVYRPASCGFTFASPSPIWDNLTECAYLKDLYGEVISTFCYGFQ